MSTTDEYMRAAARRQEVLVTRNGRQERAQLIYWPGDNPRRGSTRWRAKVQNSNGAIFVVDVGSVTLIEGENIVADEIGVDTQYRNFRGLSASNRRSETVGEVPTVGNLVGNPQPWVGCSEDESDHVA
jgi:hypothetical protein